MDRTKSSFLPHERGATENTSRHATGEALGAATQQAPSNAPSSAPAKQGGIVHEAEAQRQHVRVHLPAKLRIGEHLYETLDWSNGGMALELPDKGMNTPHFSAHQMIEGELLFGLEGYGLTLPVNVEILYVDFQNNRLGCRFAELGQEQISLLQLLVTSYINGELVGSGDIIATAHRHNFMQARKSLPDPMKGLSPEQIRQIKVRRYSNIAMLASFVLLLLAYVAYSFYSSMFIVETSNARVIAERICVSAPSSGRIYYEHFTPDARVAPGEPLFTLISESGNALSVESPCDCIVKKRIQRNNQWIVTGALAVELVNVESTPYVEAFLPHDAALKLSVGDGVSMRYSGDSARHSGKVVSIEADGNGQDNARLIIAPDAPIPIERSDNPVALRAHL